MTDAPEGWLGDDQWPSVPYYILDGSRYKSEVVTNGPEEVAVRVTSPADPRTGVQFARTFHVYSGTTRVRVDELMRNISQRQIRWGMWHLVQHDAADANDPSKPNPDLYMYVPLNRHSVFTEGYTKLYGDVRHPSDEVIDDGKMLRVHYLYRVGKVGIDSDGGWYAVVNGQKKTCFLESFKFFPGEEYPDDSSVESWTTAAPPAMVTAPFTNARRPRVFFIDWSIGRVSLFGFDSFITVAPGVFQIAATAPRLSGLLTREVRSLMRLLRILSTHGGSISPEGSL